LPVRIECFDVSTTQGRQTVGAMTVFEDAQPKRPHYRSFAVRRAEGSDDYASLAEVLSRRFARAGMPGTSEGWDESFSSVPNLVVVDGGREPALGRTRGDGGLRSPARRRGCTAKREEESSCRASAGR
jgi:excinuclease ABC subunit C